MQTSEPTPVSRGERLVVAWFIAIMALSVIAMIALFIANVNASGPIWDAVRLVPLIGLPIAMILIVVLLVVGTRRRARDAKGAGK